jgi:hypothetical protein
MRTYTFHISLPGYGRVWRKLELPSDFTLEDLHLAIQGAFAFDNDHLYSFFMSGKAWDETTEYSLPEGADPWGFGPLDEEEEDEEEAGEQLLDLDEEGEELPEPTPEQLREIFDALKADPSLMAEAKKQITQQLGIPGFLFDMIVNNSDMVLDMAGSLDGLDEEDFMETPSAGDVRETTLDALGLKKGKTFLYLFDYGDEWRFKVKVAAVNERADPTAQYPRLVESVGEAPAQYGEWDEEEENGEEAGEEE